MQNYNAKFKIHKPKIIVILGPTASGKSKLTIRLAKKFNGEVVSADSRQVYRGLDIGTGKVTRKEMEGIPHYVLDASSPKRKFTVAQYQKLACRAIEKIIAKGKIPILSGGTGFYIQAVVDGIIIPEVAPNWRLRKKLEKISNKELYQLLKKLAPQRAKTIDRENPRRLIRALEIARHLGKVPKLKKRPLPYPVLILGIKKSKEDLKFLIKKRLLKGLKLGMMAEVKRLKNSGLSWKRLEELGLEYRWAAKFLQKKISKVKMMENSQKDIEHFAKRQMTWFKRDKRTIWIKNYLEVENLVKKFLLN